MRSLTSSYEQSWLSWFLRGILILGTLVLFARLFELQVIKGNYYRDLSDGNRVRRVTINAPRGKIFARGGEVLVDNRPVYFKLVLTGDGGYQKIEVEESGLDTIIEYKRFYPLGADLAHVTGFVGYVAESELSRVEPKCPEKGALKLNSWVGRNGLEETYNCGLRGFDGEELIEVDTHGNKVRVLGRKPARTGEDIRTTIDYGLQKKAVDAIKGKIGAIVATDIKGEVLALYSSPSFDPNLFVDSNLAYSSRLENVLNDSNHPLFNRAIAGLYHPGSTFKIVTSIAALSEGKIDEKFIFDDPGVISINDFEFANWYFTQYGGLEGELGVVRAIARSTDTFFYKVGELVGIKSLASWSRKFGLEDKSGIDLAGEVTGLVPDPEWKGRVKGEKWFLGNTYHVAIGQGDLALTPLSVNQISSVVASYGKVCRPFIARRENEVNKSCRELGISTKNISLVKQGMVEACETGGTGYPFFDYNPKVACKTGTAETIEMGKTHAWFTVFAPSDDPEIILTVLVEKGGEGSSVAAPIAREILEFYFQRK
ncbi:hypothetical protein A2691_01940 [Candidatus Woesebacteria bacterium RIFCSPHIGHO2_01_FULL_39_23]|nr:MAG: hypothetical protein A2691_01940 [Candidatus Woesebacteria bacterium RIFCSPHIGHO2_01_FULL_39_23]